MGPVHVYEKSTGGYSPVAQSRSDDVAEKESPKEDLAVSESKKVVIQKDNKPAAEVEKLPVAQARSAQLVELQTGSAVVGAKVSVQSAGESLRKGTVEDIDPKE